MYKTCHSVQPALADRHTNIGAKLSDLDLTDIDDELSSTDLAYTDFTEAELGEIDFRGSELEYANFRSASLNSARFDNMDTCLNSANFEAANCDDAHFDNSTMRQVDFTDASLEGTWFRDTDLSYAMVKDAVAREANFSDANSRTATFTETNLEQANFRNADVSEANFAEAILTDADFRGAKLGDTEFRNVSANINTKFGVRNYHEWMADNTAEKHIKSDRGIKLKQLTNCEGNWKPSPQERILRYFFVSLPRGWVRIGSTPDVGDGPELDKAVRAYQAIQRVFRENSMSSLVRRYEIRERDAKRKRALTRGNSLPWIWLTAMKKLFLYSHGPSYLIASTGVTIGLLTAFLILTGVTVEGTTYHSCLCLKPWITIEAIVRTSEASLLAFLPGGNTGARSMWFGRAPFTLLSTLGTLGVSVFVVTLVQRAQH